MPSTFLPTRLARTILYGACTWQKALLLGYMSISALPAMGQDLIAQRPVKIVVPFAPGGVSDAVARPIAQVMSELLSRPVVVENKPGAAGNIALEFVARSAPDGHTLLLGNVSTNAMNQTSYAGTLKIVPTRDLTAIGVIGITPSVLVATKGLPTKNGIDFIQYARTNPGKINYWLPGIASGPHFDMVQLEKTAGIKMVAVPYSGGAGPGLAALIGGQVDIGLINLGGALAQIRADKLRGLAVSTSQRLQELPNVMTAEEAGMGSLTSSWQALFAPQGIPRPALMQLHQSLNEALNRTEVKESLARAATLLTPSVSPQEAQSFVEKETQKWARIINDSGIRPE